MARLAQVAGEALGVGVAVGEGLTAQDSPRPAEDSAPPRPHITPRHAGDEPEAVCSFVNHSPHGEVFPLRVTRYDHEIQALRRIVYGYSFECAVHGQGRRFGTVAAARAGKREHEAEHQR